MLFGKRIRTNVGGQEGNRTIGGRRLPFGLSSMTQEKCHLHPNLHTDAPSVDGRLEYKHSVQRASRDEINEEECFAMDGECDGCRFGSEATFRSR